MPIRRGPDGVPFEVPSHMPEKKPAAQPASPVPDRGGPAYDDQGDVPTKQHASEGSGQGAASRSSPRPSSLFPEEPPTRPHRKTATSEHDQRAPPVAEEPRTVIHGGASRAKSAPSRDGESRFVAATPPLAEAMTDPLAGWLVVVEGPGKGNALRVGFGQSSIGRGAGERIRLDFGDGKVSRANHAFIIYDPRLSQFYIKPGDGVNLLHIDDELVMMPRPLEDRSQILIGDTRLMFVAFCGPHFTWTDSV